MTDAKAQAKDYQLVLLRHGESEWNKLNLFTGWRDVKLTQQGEAEAREAGRILRQVTRENVKKRMAMLLIEKNTTVVLSWPVIQEELGSRFQISGIADATEAKNLALLLRAGALAAPMDIIEERTIGPSLGKENIEKGFHAVLWGFAAIAVFMILYYSVLLLALTTVLFFTHAMGLFYLICALLLGGVLVYMAIRLLLDKTKKRASTLFWYSNCYLALIFAVMVLDRVIR